MKAKKINLLIIITCFCLVGALIFSVFAFIREFGPESGVTDQDSSESEDLEMWTLEDGDIGFYFNHHSIENVSYMKFAMEGLEPGKYQITWNIRSSVTLIGANFFQGSSQTDGSLGFVYMHTPYFGKAPNGSLFDDKVTTWYVSNLGSICNHRDVIEVDENGSFSIYILRADHVTYEEAFALRDLIKLEFIDSVTLVKVG